MIFEPTPTYEKQVLRSAIAVNAFVEFVPLISVHRPDNRVRLTHCDLEGGCASRDH
jgi:hypothetical protein